MSNGWHTNNGAYRAQVAEREELVLALLEERPYTTTELAELLGVPSGLHQFLARMARASKIRKANTATGWSGRWTLPYVPAGAAVPSTPQAGRVKPEVPRRTSGVRDPRLRDDDAAPPVRDDVDEDPDLDALDELAPTKPVLRHAHERPATVNLTTGDRGSWWLGLSREAFVEELGLRARDMAASKEARRVNIQVN